jgi:hypothetical protein
MSDQVVTVDGEDKVVREDTAKSYRGVIWALTSIAIFVVILAVLVLGGFFKTIFNSEKSPAEIERTTRK